MMSVHDALEAWQAGEITAARAMELTGAEQVMELYAFAQQCDVPIRTGLLAREEAQAARAGAIIGRLPSVGETGEASSPGRSRAVA